MPEINPLIDHADGGDFNAASAGPKVTQAGMQDQPASRIGISNLLNFTGGYAGMNAAGTSENVAMHVAVLVVTALIGVYALRQTGFRFVIAAGAGAHLGVGR